MNEAADDVRTGDVKLVDQLLLPAMSIESTEAARNRERVDAAIRAKPRLLAIVPLATYSAERDVQMEWQLKIAGFHGIPRTFMSLTLGSDSKAVSLCDRRWKDGATTQAIVQLEGRKRGGS